MTTLAVRLAAKTQRDPETGCLRFTGCHNSRGYGCIGVNGKSQLAHRVAYELAVGPIPAGLTIDHVAARGCRHKDCVEPAHLEPVTIAENCARTSVATKTHCVNGHPLSGDNLKVKRRPGGRTIRNCRTCDNAQQRARRAAAEATVTAIRPDVLVWVAEQEAATAQGGAVA